MSVYMPIQVIIRAIKALNYAAYNVCAVEIYGSTNISSLKNHISGYVLAVRPTYYIIGCSFINFIKVRLLLNLYNVILRPKELFNLLPKRK